MDLKDNQYGLDELLERNNLSLEEYEKLILKKHLPWIIRKTMAFPALFKQFGQRFHDLPKKYPEMDNTLQECINSSILAGAAAGTRKLMNFCGLGNDLGEYKPVKSGHRKDEPFITDFGLGMVAKGELSGKGINPEALKKGYTAANNLLHFNWENKNEDTDSTQIIHDGALEAIRLIRFCVYDELSSNYDFKECTELNEQWVKLVESET